MSSTHFPIINIQHMAYCWQIHSTKEASHFHFYIALNSQTPVEGLTIFTECTRTATGAAEVKSK